jgi:glycosyltransferase involved in cell wall biosynthesis
MRESSPGWCGVREKGRGVGVDDGQGYRPGPLVWPRLDGRAPTLRAHDPTTPRKGETVDLQRLRIVYVDHCARLSGAELALARLVGALRDSVDPYVLLGEDGPLVAMLREAGATVEVLPFDRAGRELERGRVTAARVPVGSLVASTRYVSRLARRIRHLAPDLVHTNSLKAGVSGSLAARRARVPAVWHVHDRLAGDYLPPSAARLLRAMLGRLPAAVVANSAATRATLGPLGRRGLVIRVIGNVIAPADESRDAAADDSTRRPASPHPLRVGIVGRIAPWKGQDRFLEAFAKAFAGGPQTATVVGAPLFGPGEDDFSARLARLAGRLGIAGRVEFRGFRDDVGAELARLDVLVHASVTPEPFGQVIVEGMATGVPVIATAAGGPLELIDDGVDGILVPPGDTDAMAAALDRLDRDPELRARLGRAGRVRAAAFAPARIASEWLDLYREVLAARRR